MTTGFVIRLVDVPAPGRRIIEALLAAAKAAEGRRRKAA